VTKLADCTESSTFLVLQDLVRLEIFGGSNGRNHVIGPFLARRTWSSRNGNSKGRALTLASRRSSSVGVCAMPIDRTSVLQRWRVALTQVKLRKVSEKFAFHERSRGCAHFSGRLLTAYVKKKYSDSCVLSISWWCAYYHRIDCRRTFPFCGFGNKDLHL
jgi:hypothetical protein